MRTKAFILFLLLHSILTFAVEFQNISTSNGLSNRRVFNSVRDYKGYMWFATRVSIDRFDGETFCHYEFSKFNDNYKIRGVASDRKGQIYAYTDKYIYRYNMDLDQFSKITVAGIKESSIKTIYFDHRNQIWVGTNAGMFFSNDFKKWESIGYFDKSCIFSLLETPDNQIFVGTMTGLIRMNEMVSKEKKYSISTFLEGKRILSTYFDKTRNLLWVGSFADGLFILNTRGKETPRLLLKTSSPIRSVCEVAKNEIWIATDGSGIFTFDMNTEKMIRNYSQNDTNRDNIATNSIYNIFSFDSNIWVSTYTSGIFSCSLKTLNYQLVEHQKDNVNSLRNNHVNAVLEDNDGDLWYGTNTGISFYSVRDSKWKHFVTENQGGSSVILALCQDKSNNIWAGGYGTDLFCINKKTLRINAVNHSIQGLTPKNYIYSLYNDDNNDLWLGGTIGQLTKLNIASSKIQNYKITGINKIQGYNADTLVVATIEGLHFLNKNSGCSSFYKFSQFQKNKRNLITFINSVFVDRLYPAIIWLGTDGGGLYKFNLRKKTLAIYSTSNGLTSNYVYGIQRDAYNRLWISTENGLNCFDVQNNTFISGLEISDLSNSVFNFLAYEKCKNGNMIWGTPNGAVILNPQNIINTASLPINLRFNSLNLYYQNVVVGEKGSPLQKILDDTKYLSFNYSQRSFTFDFIDINNFSKPKTVYSWKLNGFDKFWSNISENHKAVYTNVPPGTYEFQLRASKPGSNDYILRKINIKIAPPFWGSVYAILLYLIVLILLIVFAMNYWNNRIETKNSEEKIRFFVNMAHDVRTPITLVKAPLNQLESEVLSDDGKSALQLAQRNLEKLFNLITQLLDFQKVENDSMQLSVEETALNKFIENIVSNFSVLAKEKNIELDMALLPKEHKVFIDRKKLSLCIDNLLSNAIKYTGEKGKILLKAEIKDRNLVIEVSDDGIGIPAKSQKHLFERFYRAENVSNSKATGSGIGLMLTKKLLILHKGKITFTSIEKFGTTFRIEIPCFKDSYKSTEIIYNPDIYAEDQNKQDDEKLLESLKILLVEDNDEIREFLVKQLRHEYLVSEAENGNIALEMIRQDPPDFILSDIMMPGISGFELCSILKNDIETCHIPVILLSSLSDRADIIKGLNLGADDYITKPFDMSILESKIKVIIKNRILFKEKSIDKTADDNEFTNINTLDKLFMERVIQTIEDNLSNEEFSIDQLATDMAISRSGLYKKLKSLINDNPKDLIREIRMKKAAKLLLEKRYQINEVAYLVGFTNPKHFSTFFKKYYGVTPSNYIDTHTGDGV